MYMNLIVGNNVILFVQIVKLELIFDDVSGGYFFFVI